ncbi:hypothetical protein BMS3Bbin15_01085 [archaeon BMS3Bbin15]|nr:hypothetical protein BMS3Bbin15_01085 [archaeon BMS3Bbin15]
MPNSITAETKISQIFREYPEAIDYLLDLGICECHGLEGLRKSIKEEAECRELDIKEVLEELNRRVS